MPKTPDAKMVGEAPQPENDEGDTLVKFPIPFVNKTHGYIAFPEDIVTADCATITAIVEAIKAFAKQNDEA